jgi:Mn2+/Fe2+ NRAMP family transporter
MSEKKRSKFLLALTAIGPGLFLIGYNIGTGSITTMAKVGAEYGMTLTWVLALSCIFTYILMVAYGKTTLVTGNTALFNIKNSLKYGPFLAIYIIIALVIGEILALMGIFGIVADLLQEGSRLLFGGEGFSTVAITLVLVVGLYLLLWIGNYKIFEKFLIFFVVLMVVSFVVVFFMVNPSFSSLAEGEI